MPKKSKKNDKEKKDGDVKAGRPKPKQLKLRHLKVCRFYKWHGYTPPKKRPTRKVFVQTRLHDYCAVVKRAKWEVERKKSKDPKGRLCKMINHTSCVFVCLECGRPAEQNQYVSHNALCAVAALGMQTHYHIVRTLLCPLSVSHNFQVFRLKLSKLNLSSPGE